MAARFWGFEKDGISYEGVQIEKVVDIRDVSDGLYSLEIVEGTNTATFTQPTLPSTYRKDKTEHEARIVSDDVIKKAHNALRTAHSKLTREEQVQKIPLVFPNGYKLTVKPFISAASVAVGDDEKKPEIVKPSLVAYNCDIKHKDKNGNTISQFFGHITWKFCNAAAATEMNERTGDASAQAVTDGLAGL